MTLSDLAKRRQEFPACIPLHHAGINRLIAAASPHDILYPCVDYSLTILDSTSLHIQQSPLNLTGLYHEGKPSLKNDPLGSLYGLPITALDANESILFAGGQMGEWAYFNTQCDLLTTAPSWNNIKLGQYFDMRSNAINHVDIASSRTSNTPYAALSSRNGTVTLVDINRNEQSFSSNYSDYIGGCQDNPRGLTQGVNASALSPDLGLRSVACGLTDELLVTDARDGHSLHFAGGPSYFDQDYAAPQARPGVVSTCWCEDTRTVASGLTDSRVIVHDARNWSQPLNVLDCSTRIGSVATPRQTANSGVDVIFSKFGEGPPTLAVAGGGNVVHLYDWSTGMPVLDQILEFPGPGRIAGMKFVPGGNGKYVIGMGRELSSAPGSARSPCIGRGSKVHIGSTCPRDDLE